MFQVQDSILVIEESNVAPLPQVGDTLEIMTSCFGWQKGVIKRFVRSPYYPECNIGIQRAYVLGKSDKGGWFSEYVLIPGLPLIPQERLDFEAAFKGDPDYNKFLHDLAESEVEEEQPAPFKILGKWMHL